MTGPLNYTSTIRPDKTAAECIVILSRAGVSAVAITYVSKQPDGLTFSLDTPAGPAMSDLPVNVAGVLKCLEQAWQAGDIERRFTGQEQAGRTAWRILKDWLEAQVAIINAQMVSLDEVMLPYLRVDGGRTLYEAYRERGGMAALEGRRG